MRVEGRSSGWGGGGGRGSGTRGSSFGLRAWMCADAPAKRAAPATRLCPQDNASLCIYTILSRSSWLATKELGVDAEAQGRDQGLPVSSGVQAAFPSLSSKRLTLTSPAKKSLLKGSLTIRVQNIYFMLHTRISWSTQNLLLKSILQVLEETLHYW